MQPEDLPEELRDFTSLNAENFIDYMNETGWPLDGTFTTLLSSMGRPFRKTHDRIATRGVWDPYRMDVPILSLLIFGL